MSAKKRNPAQLVTAQGRNSNLPTPRVVAVNTPETVQGMRTSVSVAESSMLRERLTGCRRRRAKAPPKRSRTRK